MSFFMQFKGIGQKYGRNIWMDLCDIDFRDSIAIDSRITKICDLLGISTGIYSQAESELLAIARTAGLDGWSFDRLLFHFNDFFLSRLGCKEAGNMGRARTIARTESDQHLEDKEMDGKSLRSQLEKILSAVSVNTSKMRQKKRYVSQLFDRFENKIPLVVLVNEEKRLSLSRELFDNDNEYNFIQYPLRKAQDAGAVVFQGEFITLKYPERL